MATINQSQLNKGRLDKFLLVLNLPTAMQDDTKKTLLGRDNKNTIQDSLQFSVYGSIVPKVVVPEEILGYAGQSFKKSTHARPPYENVTVNFTIDSEFNNYWVIYKWLDLLNDEKTSQFDSKNIANTAQSSSNLRDKVKSFNPPTLYQTNFSIFAKDEFDKNKVKFTYTNAFPVSLGQINYNYRQSGEIETTFEFAFSQMIVELL